MGLFSSIGSFLGVGGDSIFNSILGGLGSASSARSDRKAMEAQIRGSLQNTRLQGTENRRSAEYDALLGKWVQDKQREERRLGLSNWARMSKKDYGPQTYVPPEVGAMPTSAGFEQQFGDPSKPLAFQARQRGGG
jgi:hypothetical protein